MKVELTHLKEFCLAVTNSENVSELYKKNQDLVNNITPVDIINVVDALVIQGVDMAKLKTGINKFINLFYKTINNYPSSKLIKDSFLDYLYRNNVVLEEKLKSVRPFVKEINKIEDKTVLFDEIKQRFIEIEKFTQFYVIKENILFPALEKYWNNYRCVQVMWSFHDDIRRNLKKIIDILNKESFDLSKFNRISGDLFFNMLAIKFRDNKILFPTIQDTISQDILNEMLNESLEFDYPFVQAKSDKISEKSNINISNEIDLKTGKLSVEQLILLFNHLPVDITYVDENNKVKFFSAPKSRIFPRTVSVIGRDVKNCHPHESVAVVEKIIDGFRNGEKDDASFWIKVKGKFILIKYFAIRNEKNEFEGVLEVSQEIDEIKNLEGERRLLDW